MFTEWKKINSYIYADIGIHQSTHCHIISPRHLILSISYSKSPSLCDCRFILNSLNVFKIELLLNTTDEAFREKQWKNTKFVSTSYSFIA